MKATIQSQFGFHSQLIHLVFSPTIGRFIFTVLLIVTLTFLTNIPVPVITFHIPPHPADTHRIVDHRTISIAVRPCRVDPVCPGGCEHRPVIPLPHQGGRVFNIAFIGRGAACRMWVVVSFRIFPPLRQVVDNPAI